MALVVTVYELRSGRAGEILSEDDGLKAAWFIEYRAEVSGVDPATVCWHEVMGASGIPQVGVSTYCFCGSIIPYHLCRHVRWQQNPDKLAHWYIQAFFATEHPDTTPGQNQANVLASVQDITSNIYDIPPRVGEWIEHQERELYVDYNNAAVMSPTKNPLPIPAMEIIPIRARQIVQYEPLSTTQAVLQSREQKTNLSAYDGQPAGTWIIDETKLNTVTLCNGGTPTQQVTYTLKHNPAQKQGGEGALGWDAEIPLIDTHYLESGKKKPFLDDQVLTETFGYITAAGAVDAGATIPNFMYRKKQPSIDFSFLRA